jgi:hypothetical protein
MCFLAGTCYLCHCCNIVLVCCSVCRLLHFEVVDAAGEMQPLERLELIKEPLKLTGRSQREGSQRSC